MNSRRFRCSCGDSPELTWALSPLLQGFPEFEQSRIAGDPANTSFGSSSRDGLPSQAGLHNTRTTTMTALQYPSDPTYSVYPRYPSRNCGGGGRLSRGGESRNGPSLTFTRPLMFPIGNLIV